jgi:hypothetical protein
MMVSPLTLYVAEIEHAERLRRAERGAWLAAEATIEDGPARARRPWPDWRRWFRRSAPVASSPLPADGPACGSA